MTGDRADASKTAASKTAASRAAGYQIRAAEPDDLDAIAAFEVAIARVSFGDEAITDPAFHGRRVARSLGRPGEVALVAVAVARPAEPLGWAWMSARANSLTGARYGNFRSLAVAEVPNRAMLGELLMSAVLEAAERGGFAQVTGKVHASNLGMRALYRAFGFTATHITMEKRIGAGDDGG